MDPKEKQLNKKKLVYEKLEKALEKRKQNIIDRKTINKVDYRGVIFGYKLIDVEE